MIFLPHGVEGKVLRGSALFAPEQKTLTILFNKFCSSDQSAVMRNAVSLLKPRVPNVQIFMKVRARWALVPVKLLSLLALPHLFLPLQDKKCVLLAGPF